MSNRRHGFTLIELMVVIIIIGILAAIALPQIGATRDKARLATVKGDVRNIQVSQEAYYATYNRYGTYAQLQQRTKLVLSPGNTATVSGDTKTYTATVRNADITARPDRCTYVWGGATKTAGKLTCS